MNRSALLAAAAAFLLLFPLPSSLFPLSAFAAEEEIIFRGQKIYVDGVTEKKWIGDPSAGNAELILIYKGATGSLRTLNNVEARVLAIGGGGAGGYGATSSVGPGGGGGGGEVENLRTIGKGAENPRLFFSYEKNFVLSWIMCIVKKGGMK